MAAGSAPVSPGANRPGADLWCWSRDRLRYHRGPFRKARLPRTRRARYGLPATLNLVAPEHGVREHREGKRRGEGGVADHVEQGQHQRDFPCVAVGRTVAAKAPDATGEEGHVQDRSDDPVADEQEPELSCAAYLLLPALGAF